VPVLPAGKVGQEKDDGTRAAFSLAAASAVSIACPRARGLAVLILEIYRGFLGMIDSGK
jgi:hypothetical protein